MGIFKRDKSRPTQVPAAPDARRRSMLLIVNPQATTVSDRLKNVITYALQSRYDVEVIDTQERNHATRISAKAVADQPDLVVAFGGDGTANEVANGLVGTGIPFTCLPGGMTNVVCRTLGVPNDIIDATEWLLSVADRFETRQVDVGDANGRAFLFAAGAGYDAAIVKAVEARPAMKSRFTHWYYAVSAFSTFFGRYALRKATMDVTSGSFSSKAILTIAQNADTFTFIKEHPVIACEESGLESGDLSLITLDRGNPIDVPSLAARVLTDRFKVVKSRHVHVLESFTEATITSRSSEGVPLHVDGDYVGDFEKIVLTARPRALTVLA